MQDDQNCKGDAFANLLASSNAQIHPMVSAFVQDAVNAAGAHITHPTLPPHPTAFQALWLATARLATVALEGESDPQPALDAASSVYNLLITVCRYCGASLDVNIKKPDLVCPDCQARVSDEARATGLQDPAVDGIVRFALDSVTTPTDRAWWDMLEAQRQLRRLKTLDE